MYRNITVEDSIQTLSGPMLRLMDMMASNNQQFDSPEWIAE